MPAKNPDQINSGESGSGGQSRVPKRLILCFDGTGNTFQGNTGDTNIVKLLDLFNRASPNQMHYYQPGIGTYSDGPVNQDFIGGIKRSISQTLDSGFATTFDEHVIAGYRFLMRYYSEGDRIYIFGFSRGAFTARFLARLVSHVGLLSMGNEEMVPFAYKVYQDYAMGEKSAKPYMETFRNAFCRHTFSRHGKDEVVKVQFLGLFDTVGSVAAFDAPVGRTITAPIVQGTAKYIRHAVAIDERRVKFKASLLSQDERATDEDVKEVWFPGNHGDIGGGWEAEGKEPSPPLGLWQRIWKSFEKTTPQSPHTDRRADTFQLSDIALKWMIDELCDADRNLDQEYEPKNQISWDVGKKEDFLGRFNSEKHYREAITARMHDTMSFGGGSSFWKTIMWNIMEWLPIIRRWKYIADDKNRPWHYVRWPLNKGNCRDFPKDALFHYSLIERLNEFDKYRPLNDVNFTDNSKSARLCDIVPSKIDLNEPDPFVPCKQESAIDHALHKTAAGRTTQTEVSKENKDRLYHLKYERV